MLLKDSTAARNDWPMALITSTFPSNDGRVRKVELKVTKQGASKKFLRPVSEIILLLKKASTTTSTEEAKKGQVVKT